jgi:adenine-specific DNA methylase
MPKRLIEVDLPIRTISAHVRREKSIRHGHISCPAQMKDNP